MLLATLDNSVKRFLRETDLYARLTGKALVRIFTRPFYGREAVYQLQRIGVESLFIILLTGIFTGMVLGLQGVTVLTRFGATSFVGSMLGLSIVRELGPVLAALMVAGRVGSSITAELGTMAVTEQLDAYAVEGTDVVRKLVVPRFLACLISLPLLTVLADSVALFGGFVIVGAMTDLYASFYWSSVVDFLQLSDLWMGLAKPFFFGLVIASIGCHVGLRTVGGAEAVGVAAKRSVVLASIFILVSNFFLTKLFLVIVK